jgi:DNA-binding winged helix-turn-helix (wHTH) protein/tetratricopeptide (TPR) repeat protein
MLLRDGERVALTPKSLDTLVALVERHGETVTKGELLDAAWGQTAVEENSLNQSISAVRKALGEQRGRHDYIVTVTGIGYRFVAPVVRDFPLAEAEIAPVAPIPGAAPSPLPRKLAAVAALLALAIGIYAFHSPVSASGANGKRRSAVILALTNLPATPDTAWLSTAIGEMLYHELGASAPGPLRMIPPEDAVRMARDLPASRTASQQLRDIRAYTGADFALGGAVTVLAGQPGTPVRVDLHIQDLRSGEVIAATSVEGTEAQTFAMVRTLAERVRHALGVSGAAPAGGNSPIPSSARAMQLYSEGITLLRASDFVVAKDRLLAAVEADPFNALGYSALSSAWSSLGYEAKATEAAKRAFDLSPPLDRLDRLAIEGRYRLASHDWARAAEIYSAIWNLVPDSIEDAGALLEAYWPAGRIDEAKRVIVRLRALPAPLRDDPRIDLLEAQTLGATWSDYRRIEWLAGQAAEKARQRQMRSLYARARLLEARAMWSAGEPGSQTVRDEARNLCRELGDSVCLASALRADGNASLVGGRIDQAKESFNQSLAIARQSGDLASQLGVLNSLGVLYGAAADLDAADGDFQEASRVIQAIGTDSAAVHNNYAIVLISAGRFGDARKQAQVALTLAQNSHQVESEAFALLAMARLDRMGGDPRSSVSLAEKAAGVAKQSGKRLAESETECELALSLAAAGQSAAAQDTLRQSELAVRGDAASLDMFDFTRSKVLLEAEQYRDTESIARAAAEHARRNQARWFEIEADTYLARALLALGRSEEAHAIAERAAAIPQTGDHSLTRLEIRFAQLAAGVSVNRGQDASPNFAALAGEARKTGCVELELEIRLAAAEYAARSGQKAESVRLARELQDEAARKGYGGVAMRAGRMAQTRG